MSICLSRFDAYRDGIASNDDRQQVYDGAVRTFSGERENDGTHKNDVSPKIRHFEQKNKKKKKMKMKNASNDQR